MVWVSWRAWERFAPEVSASLRHRLICAHFAALALLPILSLAVLQWAVMTGNPRTARNLLLAGADAKTTDLKGNTLLHAAADGGHEEMVDILLSLGVDPRQRNRAGKRPIDVARERGYAEIVKQLTGFE